MFGWMTIYLGKHKSVHSQVFKRSYDLLQGEVFIFNLWRIFGESECQEPLFFGREPG